ncbi:hypothetical protein EJD97_005056 [Solanum chilense]|uniref:Uncharacterized protein n=1 Tax=Solanum chilense TaxID=4083 RepID=A0A6N2BT98_SOLCI|nr:hypothetical protein EJD97_005056 [Solanum chilense]
MNTRRTSARRYKNHKVQEEISTQVEEVEKVPQGSQGDQVPNIEGDNEVPEVHLELTNREIREALVSLAQALTTQMNLNMVPTINVVKRTMTSRLRDFVGMNPPIFHGSKDNWPEESGFIEWEEFNKDFLGKFFPRERKGREGRKVAPSVPKDDAPTKRNLYALWARRSKPDENDDNYEDKSSHFF